MACIAVAETMRDPVERATMLQVAKGYRSLADYVGAWCERGSAHRSAEADQRVQNNS
jgi:hypothetical protein